MPRADSQVANNTLNANLILMPTILQAPTPFSKEYFTKEPQCFSFDCFSGSNVHEADRLTTLKTLPFAFNHSLRSSARSGMDTGLSCLDHR